MYNQKVYIPQQFRLSISTVYIVFTYQGWKLQPKVGSEESNVKIIPRWQTKTSEVEQYPVEVAIERLLQVESNIERRYLKPPLCKV